MQDRDDPRNKLKLGEFHRNATFRNRNRKVTVKKQIRDIERLLDRTGLPEEVRTAKKALLKSLKKDFKKQREAELFESKYKKIKFTEKRKVIRMLESVKCSLNQSKDHAERQQHHDKLKTLKDQLTYINHFPLTQKYISLFPKNDDEKSRERRAEAMEKVLKIAAHKYQMKEKDFQEDLAADIETGGQEKK